MTGLGRIVAIVIHMSSIAEYLKISLVYPTELAPPSTIISSFLTAATC
jgi:hypothetical protein